jgi:hypothetical protein
VRSIELALFADVLAGEAATVAARAERARSRLRQAAVEREARRAMDPGTIARLEAAGILRSADERALRAELAEQLQTLEALERLQAWVEERLMDASAA